LRCCVVCKISACVNMATTRSLHTVLAAITVMITG
ncbi:RQC domain protein, partial [Vibrio parahaemolyticus V-223/04]